MKLFNFKAVTLALSCALLPLSAVAFDRDSEYAKSQKELKIMSKIFETSLEELRDKRSRFHPQQVQSTYLAKQGMVFTFQFGRNNLVQSDWSALGEGIGQMVGAIASEVGQAFAEAPLPPEPPVLSGDDENFQFHYEEYFDAYQQRMEALEEMREHHRDQREEVRDLQREIRTLERQTERRVAQEKELDEVKQELEQKIAALNQKMDKYKKSMEDYRRMRDQKYVENAKVKAQTIYSTLCDYGRTMRSLDSDEYITLVFKDFHEDKDQIHVLESDDVIRCDDAKKLTDKAIQYLL